MIKDIVIIGASGLAKEVAFSVSAYYTVLRVDMWAVISLQGYTSRLPLTPQIYRAGFHVSVDGNHKLMSKRQDA